jgi:hypothetical protein
LAGQRPSNERSDSTLRRHSDRSEAVVQPKESGPSIGWSL